MLLGLHSHESVDTRLKVFHGRSNYSIQRDVVVSVTVLITYSHFEYSWYNVFSVVSRHQEPTMAHGIYKFQTRTSTRVLPILPGQLEVVVDSFMTYRGHTLSTRKFVKRNRKGVDG